jgi:hypothetical protein
MNWLLKVLGAVVVVGLIPLLQAEAYGWCFWLAERVIRRAAGVLPEPARGRYQAEWLADLDMLKGRNLFALLWAIKTPPVRTWGPTGRWWPAIAPACSEART